jgi:diguanylate cyclase (GGDEF)-like protein/PAS domain S-box-containing protein
LPLFLTPRNERFFFSSSIVYHDRGHQMNEQARTNPELIEEISILKQKIKELEHSEAERKQAEQALKESNDKLLSLVANVPGYIAYVNADTLQYEFVNDAFEKSFGIPREKIIGSHIKEIIGETNYQLALKYIDEVRLGKSISYENTFNLVSGKHWIRVNYAPIIDANGHVASIVVLSYDITDRKQSEEKIQQMAYHDSLTGLPNRKLFSDRLGIALAQAQRNKKKVVIAMLDLDNFKDVNDTLGHDVGDLLLKSTSERLSAALRKGDTVARFGGDEFLLILLDLELIVDAIQVAQKIVDSFRKPFPIDTHQLIVTTSIGIAVYPHDGIDEGILLKNADIAMYQAKQAGRDRYQLYKEA